MSIVSMFDVVDTKEKGRCRKQNEQEKGCVAVCATCFKTACGDLIASTQPRPKNQALALSIYP